jgi:hypothetical protein
MTWAFPFFAPDVPRADKAFRHDDQIAMLDAARAAAPADKQTSGADNVFLLLLEQRQGALAFIVGAVGALYGLTLPLPDRDALHSVFGVMAGQSAVVNAHHAGLCRLGHHPRISRNDRHVGIVFAPFWVIVASLNTIGWMAAAS